MKYIPLFILIQLASLVLFIPGLFVVAFCLAAYGSAWPKWAWIWWNDEDGAGPHVGFWNEWYWLAYRNSVNNLRYVPGVSAKGRPLYYRTWLVKGKLFYFKAGWLSDGYPVISAGAGRGY